MNWICTFDTRVQQKKPFLLFIVSLIQIMIDACFKCLEILFFKDLMDVAMLYYYKFFGKISYQNSISLTISMSAIIIRFVVLGSIKSRKLCFFAVDFSIKFKLPPKF